LIGCQGANYRKVSFNDTEFSGEQSESAATTD
jgi:hypothetical protein